MMKDIAVIPSFEATFLTIKHELIGTRLIIIRLLCLYLDLYVIILLKGLKMIANNLFK